MAAGFDTVLVVDFGAQYAQLIARRVREAHVYSEIVPHSATAEEMARHSPKGIILSGGPMSVYADQAPMVDPAVYELGVPVLGICYGAQLIVQQLGGEVRRTGSGEYGRTELHCDPRSVLLSGWPDTTEVWMSHADSIVAAPPGSATIASTPDVAVAAFEHVARGLFGVQFHPEVAHTPRGQELLKRFLYDICDCRPTWTHISVIEAAIDEVRATVGEAARAVRPLGRRRLGGDGGARPQGRRRPALVRLRRHGPHARRRGRAGRGDLPPPVRRSTSTT